MENKKLILSDKMVTIPIEPKTSDASTSNEGPKELQEVYYNSDEQSDEWDPELDQEEDSDWIEEHAKKMAKKDKTDIK